MKMERIMIQLPKALRIKLNALKAQGYTASGFVRFLLERELNSPKKKGV
jgi:mannitol/fructose-specific phosphotransferase system IIA component